MAWYYICFWELWWILKTQRLSNISSPDNVFGLTSVDPLG